MKRFVGGRAVAKGLVVGLAALSTLFAGCSRDHIEAVNLANEGDKSYKVNVEGAISKYEQAAQLDPKSHLILWKLARAYEKKEDWEKMASTLSRAVSIAPDYANYWYKRGFAIMQQARAGEADRYEEAKDPLMKCIAKDPNLAECYHELAEAHIWTDQVQPAVENYMKSIEHAPEVGYFYPPLGQTLVSMKLYDPAAKVLTEGTRVLKPTERNMNHIFGSYVLLAKIYQAKNDQKSMVGVLEKAAEIGGKQHPEIKFHLGSTYATMDPPQKEKAVTLLKSFNKLACRGGKAKKFKEQCQTASNLIQKLGK